MKRRKLLDGELFRASVKAQALFREGLAHDIRFGERPQVVHKSFALLGKTQFHEIQKSGFVTQSKMCSFAGKTERHQCGADFGRRAECFAGNAQDKFRASVDLRDDGEIAELFRPRFRGEAKGDFLLNDDVNLIDPVRERKEVVENRRGDVVRQVAVDADAPAGGDRGEIGFQDIAGNDREIREFFREALKACQEQRIQFDCVDCGTSGGKVLGHFPVAGADFNPAVRAVRCNHRALGRVRRDTDGARDLFAPAGIRKEMLAKTLTSHEPKV